MTEDEKDKAFTAMATYIAAELSDRGRTQDSDPAYAHEAWLKMRESGHWLSIREEMVKLLWERSPILGQIAHDNYIIRK